MLDMLYVREKRGRQISETDNECVGVRDCVCVCARKRREIEQTAWGTGR